MRVPQTEADHADADVEAPPADNAASSFDRIYAEHFPFVWRCLRGLGVPDATLDDAVQDVFVVVHRQLASFRGRSTLRTWLYGILRNVASNHRRSARRKAERQETFAGEFASAAPGPLERVQNAQAAVFVQGFLSGIAEKKRDVFILAVLEEMSIPEVATTLSIPLNTAYTRLRSARADFQRALDGHRGRA